MVIAVTVVMVTYLVLRYKRGGLVKKWFEYISLSRHFVVCKQASYGLNKLIVIITTK